MSIVGLALCPADAHQKIKSMAQYIFESKGGDGVIREFYDYFFKVII